MDTQTNTAMSPCSAERRSDQDSIGFFVSYEFPSLDGFSQIGLSSDLDLAEGTTPAVPVMLGISMTDGSHYQTNGATRTVDVTITSCNHAPGNGAGLTYALANGNCDNPLRALSHDQPPPMPTIDAFSGVLGCFPK